MDVAFSPRENGACPFCRHIDACAVRKRLVAALNDLGSGKGQGMEIVIYACPRFVEKA
jgi:hypothetical protein